MAWFANHYTCAHCGGDWTDEWSCQCDDDCPHCGARHMSPMGSDDLSVVVQESADGTFTVLLSPDEADDTPRYAPVATFADRAEAEAWSLN